MTIVVKLGGELITADRAEELGYIVAGLKDLRARGQRLIVVHGGGPQISALQKALGQTPKMVGGRRVTDAEALETLKMAVGGKVNIDLVSALRRGGVSAVGLNGVSGRVIQCDRRPAEVVAGGGMDPVDYGFVGRIRTIDGRLIDAVLDLGHVPVFACIGGDDAGRPFNINADEVATGIARAVAAEALVMLTSTPGVLRDKSDPASRWPVLAAADGRAAIADGTVQGGMIPKLEEALSAVEAGVGRVLIVGRLGPGELQEALREPGRIGTSIVNGA